MSKLTDYVVNKITLGEVCGVYEIVCPSMLRHHVSNIENSYSILLFNSKPSDDPEVLSGGFTMIIEMLVRQGDIKIL